MIVQSAQLNLSAQHARFEQQRESLQVEYFPAQDRGAARPPPTSQIVANTVQHRVQPAAERAQVATALTPELQLLKQIIEAITGQLIELLNPTELQGEPPNRDTTLNQLETSQIPRAPTGEGLRISASRSYAEYESMRFQASGQIHTNDGQTIDFSIELDMSRSLVRQESLSIEAGNVPQLKDPLVINYAGGAAQLTQDRYSFDIDADGVLDQIPGLTRGRALLVLDRNADGILNDASEIVGAESGQAFRELQALDDDGNGFVDAGDAAWEQLALWRPGNTTALTDLHSHGIAALSSDSVASAFELHDSQQNLAGQLRRSSIFLADNGRVGTTQQIDFLI